MVKNGLKDLTKKKKIKKKKEKVTLDGIRTHDLQVSSLTPFTIRLLVLLTLKDKITIYIQLLEQPPTASDDLRFSS